MRLRLKGKSQHAEPMELLTTRFHRIFAQKPLIRHILSSLPKQPIIPGLARYDHARPSDVVLKEISDERFHFALPVVNAWNRRYLFLPLWPSRKSWADLRLIPGWQFQGIHGVVDVWIDGMRYPTNASQQP
jgi:hypothetical protein